MGDTSTRKDLTNSSPNSSKSRRSRSELIRMALGVYLKQKNYVATEKFRKSDLFLSQTPKQFVFNKMIEEDVSHSNAFLYSNGLCLNNNHAAVEQQFSKFVEFVQKQNDTIRTELSNLFGPLICHLYIELLKGREWKPAWNFLRNHAHHIAPVENLNAPLPNKVNGCSINSNSHEDTTASGASFPAATTQIQFSSESTGNSHRDHFRDLIQSLSACLRIEACDATDSIGVFRSSKYELEISLDAINVLKQYLNRHGHVLILNILQTWIYLDIKDITAEDGKSMFNLQPDSLDDRADSLNGPDIKPSLHAIKREMVDVVGKAGETKMPRRTNVHLRQLKHAVHRCKKIEMPVRTIEISDPTSSLICGSMDSNECHVVAGFNDTTIKLWQANNRTALGRNMFRKIGEKLCDWNVGKDSERIEEFDSSDDEESSKKIPLRSTPYSYKAIRKKDFAENKCDDNSFDDFGGVTLRGHSRGVTDVMFSSHHPLMFSVSRDQTMRAWQADSYSCGAIYRGHNYPIWCINESPIPSYLATGSRDYTARLWSTDREFPLITYVGHTQDVECIAFHPNGNYLATGSCDLSVRLWSTTDGKLLRVFADCRYPVTSIAFSPNGKLLAAAGEETKIRIFDLAAGSQIAELREHSAFVSSISWNASSSKFASCCVDGSIRIWDVTKMTTSDTQAQSSSSQSASTRLVWHMSGCKRAVKIQFNSNDNVTCIGGS